MIDRDHDRRHVAWDLETTGFGWNDVITVSGIWLPGAHAELVVNTSGNEFEASMAESHLEDVSGASVSVTVADDERELLAVMGQQLFERFDRDHNRLVAYNADSWQGGFDLPFLRTRAFHHDAEWVFDGIQFADLWEPVKKRLNTTHTAYGNSSSVNSLTGAHEILFDESSPRLFEEDTHPWYRERPYDPFTNSGSAVACYDAGEYLPILQHNLADVHRTWELGELVRAFVASKDITTKKL